jgi:hypothetical protein
VLHPQSEEELTDILQALMEDPASIQPDKAMMARRKEFRERYFWKPDGNAGKRTLQKILEIVRENRGDSPSRADGPTRSAGQYAPGKATETDKVI